MEIRTVQAILLGHRVDELMNISYLKILTEEYIESVKLPTAIQNYRLQHLLQPNFLLEMELVKTKKNWIVKGILNHREFCLPTNYAEHLKIAEIINLINKYSREGQELKILDLLIITFESTKLTDLDLVDFESKLLERLGFAPCLAQKTNLPIYLYWVKSNSGLL